MKMLGLQNFQLEMSPQVVFGCCLMRCKGWEREMMAWLGLSYCLNFGYGVIYWYGIGYELIIPPPFLSWVLGWNWVMI